MAENLDQAKEIVDLTQKATDLFMSIVSLSFSGNDVASIGQMSIVIKTQIDMASIGMAGGTIQPHVINIVPVPPLQQQTRAYVVADLGYEFGVVLTRLAELGVPWDLSPNLGNHAALQELWDEHNEHIDLPDFTSGASQPAGRTMAEAAGNTDQRPKPRSSRKR